MGLVYLDSSVLLDFILRKKKIELGMGPDWSCVTSEISELECTRTIDRVRIENNLSDEEVLLYLEGMSLLFKYMSQVPLQKSILKRAKAAFPTVVRNLDAIHLASAEAAKVEFFLTHDKQQSTAARALGFKTQKQ